MTNYSMGVVEIARKKSWMGGEIVMFYDVSLLVISVRFDWSGTSSCS